MIIVTAMLGIAVTYLTAVAGARGHGSRRLWIACIFFGLTVAVAAEMIGQAYLGHDTQLAFMSGGGVLANVLIFVFRVAIGFSIGSILAVFLCRKKPSIESVGLK